MWKNIVDPDRPQMTIRRMSIASVTPKSTNTHSEYVILTPFSRQQWLRERDSMPLLLTIANIYCCWYDLSFLLQIWLLYHKTYSLRPVQLPSAGIASTWC